MELIFSDKKSKQILSTIDDIFLKNKFKKMTDSAVFLLHTNINDSIARERKYCCVINYQVFLVESLSDYEYLRTTIGRKIWYHFNENATPQELGEHRKNVAQDLKDFENKEGEELAAKYADTLGIATNSEDIADCDVTSQIIEESKIFIEVKPTNRDFVDRIKPRDTTNCVDNLKSGSDSFNKAAKIQQLQKENAELKSELEEIKKLLPNLNEVLSELSNHQEGWEDLINNMERILEKHKLPRW